MNIKLAKASKENQIVIANLMQFYMYDFSEYLRFDVNDNGLFEPYPNLEDYWKEEGHKFPYIITNEGKHVGFVLIRYIQTVQRNYFSVAEFFIMKKYRREGIGKTVALQVFDLHKGQWEVYQKESNKPAQVFWNKVIAEYTNGRFKERFEDGKRIQDFENYSNESV